MHAVVIKASTEPDRVEEAWAYVDANVLQAVKEAPGLVAGYWLEQGPTTSPSVVVFEGEAAARGAAEMAPKATKPDFISFDSVEVHEVRAQV